MLIKKTINAIIEFIEENIEKKLITIDMLVNYSGYSRRYLQLIFHRYTGFSLGRYIQLRRVTLAAVYLHLTRLSLPNIAERLCYDSQQTFNREFKKHTGHTPRQYRENKIWDFRKQTGYSFLDFTPPKPEVRFLETMTVHGSLLSFRQKIPSSGITSRHRWQELNTLLNKKEDNTIRLSNKFEPCGDNNEIIVNTVVWDNNKDSGSVIQIAEGTFAYFRFTGNIDEYTRYMYHVYMNTLPFYGLTKRDDYDIEIISKNDDSNYSIEYYLPVSILMPAPSPSLLCPPSLL